MTAIHNHVDYINYYRYIDAMTFNQSLAALAPQLQCMLPLLDRQHLAQYTSHGLLLLHCITYSPCLQNQFHISFLSLSPTTPPVTNFISHTLDHHLPPLQHTLSLNLRCFTNSSNHIGLLFFLQDWPNGIQLGLNFLCYNLMFSLFVLLVISCYYCYTLPVSFMA